jgi:hypothetical protein
MGWSPLNLTVRVRCSLAYETSVPTPVLFVLKPRLDALVALPPDSHNGWQDRSPARRRHCMAGNSAASAQCKSAVNVAMSHLRGK